MNVIALLESMWGWGGYNDAGEEAPRFFRINPDNFSGRRLYRMVGPSVNLLVTNSCRIVQPSAKNHGTPDPAWVAANLKSAEPFDLLLVCGKVAQETYDAAGLQYLNVIRMDHPAARRWSNAKLDAVTAQISAMAVKKGCYSAPIEEAHSV
jgi:hypothetical protein